MKKFFCILVAFVLCVSTLGICASAVRNVGDVNGDGNEDNLDAAAILKYDAGIIDLDDGALSVGDVNYDGNVDNVDAALVLKYDVGLISQFCEMHRCYPGNCITPDVCADCGLKIYTKYDHLYDNGVCEICGYVREGTAKGVLTDYIIENGIYDEETGCYAFIQEIDDNTVAIFEYDPEMPEGISFSTLGTYTSRYMYITTLWWEPDLQYGEAITLLMDSEGTIIGYGGGYIPIPTISWSFQVINGFQREPADAGFPCSNLEDITIKGVLHGLGALNVLLEDIPEYNLKDYGFSPI